MGGLKVKDLPKTAEGIGEKLAEAIIDGDALANADPSDLMIKVASMPKEWAMEAIVNADCDVAEKRNELKTIAGTLSDQISALPEHNAVLEAKSALEAAKKKLNAAILKDEEIQDNFERHADAKKSVQSAEGVLSGLLVLYSAHHKVRSIEMDDKEYHEIVIKAKVGRKIKQQLELPL